MANTKMRPYQAQDKASCMAIFESNVPAFFAPSERKEFSDFLDDEDADYAVLEMSGEIVGCGGWAITGKPDTAVLCWGMIHNAYHAGGLGRTLTEARIADIRNQGLAAVSINTSQHTEAFYERFGFVAVQRTKDGFAVGLDDVEMILDLKQSGD